MTHTPLAEWRVPRAAAADSARIYFDWNSTTPPLPEALEAMRDAPWANPSSVHAEGRTAGAVLDRARDDIGQLVTSDAHAIGQVVFTSGGTEASNIAIRSPFVDCAGALIVSPLEHASVRSVTHQLRACGVDVREAGVEPTGVIDVRAVLELLRKGDVRLVILQAVNGETGVIQPVAEVARMASDFGAHVHVDAIQAIGRVASPPGGWLAHAHTVAIASHKIRGPKGIGALVTRRGVELHPVVLGGSQEKGVRPGTQDAALAAGFGAAARAALDSEPAYAAVAIQRDRLQGGLESLGAVVNGTGARAPHVVHVSFRGRDSAELVAALDRAGLAVSGGPACSSGRTRPSPTILAMFPDEPWRATSTVRFSLPPWTTAAEVDRALAITHTVLTREA